MVKNGWAKDSHGWCFLNAIERSGTGGMGQDSKGWGYFKRILLSINHG